MALLTAEFCAYNNDPPLTCKCRISALACKSRMPSNVEYARTEPIIRRLPVNWACRKHRIPCFRQRRFCAYGKQSHEIGRRCVTIWLVLMKLSSNITRRDGHFKLRSTLILKDRRVFGAISPVQKVVRVRPLLHEYNHFWKIFFLIKGDFGSEEDSYQVPVWMVSRRFTVLVSDGLFLPHLQRRLHVQRDRSQTPCTPVWNLTRNHKIIKAENGLLWPRQLKAVDTIGNYST